MFKNLIRNKRALSPIFATLIILAVVTVLFIPVFIWATGLSSQTQEGWQSSGITATERIVIEEVNLAGDQPTQNCTIYVRNIGETAVTINNVLISQDNTNIHAFQKLPILYPIPLPPPPVPSQLSTVNPITGSSITSIVKGDLIEIRIPNLASVNQTYTINNGVTYTIQVFTTRGVSDTYQTVASW